MMKDRHGGNERVAQLDPIDRAIIAALQENASITNRLLAVRANSTESTARRRRAALIRRGVIRITATVDPFQLGYDVMALFGMHVDSRKLGEAESALAEMPELRFVGMTLGSYDFLTEAWFVSTSDLVDFVTARLNKVPGVQRTETLQIAKLVKYGYDWGHGPGAPVEGPG